MMSCNYYIRLKKPVEHAMRLGDIVEMLEMYMAPENPNAMVKMLDRRPCHIAKCSWGWETSFQAVPSERAFGCTAKNGEHYSIESVADIRNYLRSGEYEIVDEYDTVISPEDFERLVVSWSKHMRDNGYEGEIRSHGENDYNLMDYRDPLGYQFCRVCFC